MSTLSAPVARQSGIALITGLIILVILTMIGITAARMSGLEERMSGNLRDREIAVQAAELALRDAERDINNTVTASARGISGLTGFVADCGLSAGVAATYGLCYNGTGGYVTPIWIMANMTAAPSVQYGTFTGAGAIPNLSAQPRYILEGIRKMPPGSGETFYYRITVRAQGANANTVVWLQELFTP